MRSAEPETSTQAWVRFWLVSCPPIRGGERQHPAPCFRRSRSFFETSTLAINCYPTAGIYCLLNCSAFEGKVDTSA